MAVSKAAIDAGRKANAAYKAAKASGNTSKATSIVSNAAKALGVSSGSSAYKTSMSKASTGFSAPKSSPLQPIQQTPSYMQTPAYTAPKSQLNSYDAFGDISGTGRSQYTGQGLKLSSGDEITQFSKPLSIPKELDVYGEEAKKKEQLSPGTLATRNDTIAYNLKAGGVDTVQGIADYLAKQAGFAQATAEEQQNTIASIAARMGVNLTREQQVEKEKMGILDVYDKEMGKLVTEAQEQDVVKRMDFLLGEEIRPLNANEINQISQETGLTPEQVKQTSDKWMQSRQRMADPYQQAEEKQRIDKERNIEDANIQLQRTEQQINNNIADITKDMERNVAGGEKVGALKGYIQSSGYTQGLNNIKNDANELINRQRTALQNANADTVRYIGRTNEDFSRNMDIIHKQFKESLLSLRLAGTNEVNSLLTRYSPSDKILGKELERLTDEYGQRSFELASKAQELMNNAVKNSFTEMEKIQEYETKQRQLEDITMSQLYSNNGAALMNMSDAQIQNLADQGYISQDQVPMLISARESFKQQTQDDTTLQFKTDAQGNNIIFNPKTGQTTILGDKTGAENYWSQANTTNVGEKDWDTDLNVGDQVTTPVSGTVHFERHQDGNIAVEITTKDGYKVELSHLDPSTIQALQYLEGQTVNAGDVVGLGGNSGNVMDINGNWLRKDGQVFNQQALDQGVGSHLDTRVVDPNGRDLSGEEVKRYIQQPRETQFSQYYNPNMISAYTQYIENNKRPTEKQLFSLGGLSNFSSDAYNAYIQNENKKLDAKGFKLTEPDFYASLDSDERKSLNTDMSTIMNVIRKTDSLISDIDKNGLPDLGQTTFGRGRELRQKIKDLQLVLKEKGIYNLGVLNGPDLDIIEGALPNIDTKRWVEGKDQYIKYINNIKSIFVEQINGNNIDKGIVLKDEIESDSDSRADLDL